MFLQLTSLVIPRYALTFYDFTYGMVPIPGDYDGDGTCDRALIRPGGANLRWLIREADGNNRAFSWGYTGDTVKALDFDGDGATDPVIWREYGAYSVTWFIRSIGKIRYGYAADIPVTGDFDGDGNYNIGVFWGIEGRWYINNPAGPNFKQRYG